MNSRGRASGRASGGNDLQDPKSHKRIGSRDSSPIRDIDGEIAAIHKDYISLLSEKKKKQETDESKLSDYRNLITRLRTLFDSVDDATLLQQIQGLKNEIDSKFNRTSPPFIKLSPDQLTLQQAARDAIEEWNAAGTGSDYDELPPELQARVNEIIGDSGISEILAEKLKTAHLHFNTPQKMLVLLNSIKKLFRMKIAESCFNLRESGIDIVMSDDDDRNYVVTLATTCVNCILGAFIGPSAVTFAAKAVSVNPKKAAIDTASLVFAGAVLAQCSAPVAVDVLAASKALAGKILEFMVSNPAESFVSGQWSYEQLKNLYANAIQRMYPDQEMRTIQRVVDTMDENFLKGSRAGLVGDEVTDTTTLTGKLSWVSHKLKSAFVGQTEFMGRVARNAISFPNFMLDLAMNAFDKLKQVNDNMALCLMDRFGFIPGESDDKTFEHLLMSALSEQGLIENEKVQRRAIRLLRRGNSQTPWKLCVRVHSALHDDATLPIAPPNESQGSTFARSGETPQGNLSPRDQQEYKGPLGDREIDTDEELSIGESGQQNDSALQSFSFLSSRARGGLDGLGGRSRSRKRSVSKRTRRKGVAKKQKSNKNKRQSRRKLRRASSRKGRK